MRREGSKAKGLLRFAIVAALVVIGAAIAAALLADDDFSGDSQGARWPRRRRLVNISSLKLESGSPPRP